MEKRQQTQVIEENIEQAKPISREKKLLGYMLILAAITTLVFVIHVQVNASMNYESWRAPTLSYFTIQSNIIIVMWLIFLSGYMITGSKAFAWCANINLTSAITTYILVTGVIYWGVLTPMLWSSAENTWLFSSSNIWLHTTTPIITVFMHSYTKQLNERNDIKASFLLFYIYPALYMIMAMNYALKGVYLYPIFNPEIMGGWIGVAICILIMLIVFTGLYLLLLSARKSKAVNE